jgi:hypothetical protein
MMKPAGPILLKRWKAIKIKAEEQSEPKMAEVTAGDRDKAIGR